MWLQYHMMAFLLGFLLDLLVGDPASLPHPVRMIGSLISWLEKRLYLQEKEREPGRERHRGRILVRIVLLVVGSLTTLVLLLTYRLHPLCGMLAETVMTCQLLAAACLKKESMKVAACLQTQGLEQARYAVSMIVGRDTESLDEEGVIKAAVETVAENTSDGVITPMLYAALGGPVLGFLYKAVNTMDSMIGYKNDRYLYFGRAAAKLDDAAGYLPSRISACLMILAAALPGGGYDAGGAYRIYKRDRHQHASPNSAQTESVCAGALGIRLAGDASYFGRVLHKPFIGDAGRSVECQDIARAGRLMYRTAWLSEILCLIGMGCVLWLW